VDGAAVAAAVDAGAGDGAVDGAAVVVGAGGTGSATAELDGRAMVIALAPATAVTANAVHRPGRRELESDCVMAKNLPCYSRDASSRLRCVRQPHAGRRPVS